MSDELPKHELLRKLLNMTTSSNDAEALVAMRKANSILSSSGWSWDQLLAGKIRLIGDPWKGMAPTAPRESAAARAAKASPPRQAPRPPPPRQYIDIDGIAWPTQASVDLANQQIRARRNARKYIDVDGGTWSSQADCDRANAQIRARNQRAASPKVTIGSTRTNGFSGNCYCCGTFVNAGAGWIFKPSSKWLIACDPCNKSTNPIPTRPAKPITTAADILNSFS